MKESNKMNGSVGLLAEAMRKVFQEATAQAVEPVMEEMTAMEERLDNKIDGHAENLDKRISTAETNMSAQFGQQKKDISDEIKRQLVKR